MRAEVNVVAECGMVEEHVVMEEVMIEEEWVGWLPVL
jgi:hypothetical protein